MARPRPYVRKEIKWPPGTVQSVEGPCMYHGVVRELLGDNPTDQQLRVLEELANNIFEAGSCHRQYQIQRALGIKP